MTHMLKYSSSRFQPRINDYTYPQRRVSRITAAHRNWFDLARPDSRTPVHNIAGTNGLP